MHAAQWMEPDAVFTGKAFCATHLGDVWDKAFGRELALRRALSAVQRRDVRALVGHEYAKTSVPSWRNAEQQRQCLDEEITELRQDIRKTLEGMVQCRLHKRPHPKDAERCQTIAHEVYLRLMKGLQNDFEFEERIGSLLTAAKLQRRHPKARRAILTIIRSQTLDRARTNLHAQLNDLLHQLAEDTTAEASQG